jgi:hypothetical protein
MINECGAVGGMRTGRGNRSSQRKPAPVPLYTPTTLYYLVWHRTRIAEVVISYGTGGQTCRKFGFYYHSVCWGFLFVGYFTPLSVARIYRVEGRTVHEWRIGSNLDESARNTIPAVSCGDWGKPLKASVRVTGVPAEIRTEPTALQLRQRARWSHLCT